MKKLLLSLFLIGCVFFTRAQTTKVYIVRHAEKSSENQADADPELTTIGMQRAEALTKKLSKEQFDAVFSTNYKRTRNTGAGIAAKNKREVLLYNPSAPKALVERIKKEYNGKTVLIVGHSNTILELAEAFGATRPIKELTDDDYDNLILVKILNNEVTVELEKFGVSHHSGN